MALYNSYNNYLSNSQHYPFILAIINHNPQLGNQTPLGNELYIYIYIYMDIIYFLLPCLIQTIATLPIHNIIFLFLL